MVVRKTQGLRHCKLLPPQIAKELVGSRNSAEGEQPLSPDFFDWPGTPAFSHRHTDTFPMGAKQFGRRAENLQLSRNGRLGWRVLASHQNHDVRALNRVGRLSKTAQGNDLAIIKGPLPIKQQNVPGARELQMLEAVIENNPVHLEM